jgi:hypothetical protein
MHVEESLLCDYKFYMKIAVTGIYNQVSAFSFEDKTQIAVMWGVLSVTGGVLNLWGMKVTLGVQSCLN